MKPQTQAAAALGWVAPPFNAIVPPLHPATTFERAVDGSYPGGRQYSRADSPAYDQPEAVLAALEKGADALLLSSGMAAATAVFQALQPGATVFVPRVMYWGLRRWLEGPARDWGLQVHGYPNGDLDALERLCAVHPPDLLWIETPANPTWEIQDIAASVVVAKRSGAIVVADSTVATPVHTQPLTLGADIVMHSATKYLNGHSDVVAGALITAELTPFWERIIAVRAQYGAVLGPFEAWLLLRGMRTLFLRVPAASATAARLAEWLTTHPAVATVLYPGLPTHPGHAVACRQMQAGFGGMLSLRLRAGESAVQPLLGRLRLFKQATSLGSVESLIEHRASVEGEGSPCPPDLLRLSLGIEDCDDLQADLDQALHGAG